MNEEPIPRGCKSIEEAVELIEAMRQDGEHGFIYFDGSLQPSFQRSSTRERMHFIFPVSCGLGRDAWADVLNPEEISQESIRMLWLSYVYRWETKNQRKWTGPGA